MLVNFHCGHNSEVDFTTQVFALNISKCEKCFVQEQRTKKLPKLIGNGRRFRYLVPASSLPRIPLGHSSTKGFRVSYSRA